MFMISSNQWFCLITRTGEKVFPLWLQYYFIDFSMIHKIIIRILIDLYNVSSVQILHRRHVFEDSENLHDLFLTKKNIDIQKTRKHEFSS